MTTVGAISQISNVARSAYRLLKQANHQVTQKHILRISHSYARLTMMIGTLSASFPLPLLIIPNTLLKQHHNPADIPQR